MEGTLHPASKSPLAVGAPGEVALNADYSLQTGDQPFRGGIAITPGASVITAKHRALWIGTGGTLIGTMLDANGTTANAFSTTVADGSVFPFRCLTITSGSTATGILAGW